MGKDDYMQNSMTFVWLVSQQHPHLSHRCALLTGRCFKWNGEWMGTMTEYDLCPPATAFFSPQNSVVVVVSLKKGNVLKSLELSDSMVVREV